LPAGSDYVPEPEPQYHRCRVPKGKIRFKHIFNFFYQAIDNMPKEKK